MCIQTRNYSWLSFHTKLREDRQSVELEQEGERLVPILKRKIPHTTKGEITEGPRKRVQRGKEWGGRELITG